MRLRFNRLQKGRFAKEAPSELKLIRRVYIQASLGSFSAKKCRDGMNMKSCTLGMEVRKILMI